MQADPYVSSNAPLEIRSTTTTCTHVHTEPVNLFFFSIQSKLQEVGCLPPQCMFYTFDLIVQPILAYGSDVWHITTVGGTAVGEAFLFVRVVLHVNVTISNITTFGECDLVQSSVICSIHSVLRYVRTCKIRDLNIDLSVWIEKRAGQDQGGPRWDTLTKKIKVNQIASYCAMLYPRCCSLWPCTFWGLHSSAFDSSAGQTRGSHFNFYWGTDTTMWSYVHFSCPCVYQNWLLSPTVELASQKAYKTTKKKEIKMCLFVFENKFEHVTSNTQFRLAQIRVATFLHIRL